MTCPSPEAIALYVDGTGVSRSAIHAHVDACDDCRRTVAATIRAARAADPVHDDGVAIGTVIDRYVIRGARGSGAMGHVYEAHDPELDRLVALKVVRHHDADGDARALREGRALAKLAHPNVVAVHDVGTFPGGVFLAMELVAGATVRVWAKDRSTRELVTAFAAAARGLAAAHAAGLVHRDVKPENLLVGDDGRVRVIDFGLAIIEGTRAAAAGTPRYMEAGGPGKRDARSDQYAFARSLGELSGSRTKRWLAAVIARASDPDPARRYASMTAVATALERGLARPRRFALAGMVAIAAGAAAAGGMLLGGEPIERDACDVDANWTEGARTDVARRFASHTGPIPLADVLAVLDGHASSWSTAYRAACEAETQRSTPQGRQRLICLDGHLRQRDAVLALADPAELAAGALALPPPPDCTDAVVALVPGDVGPTTRASIDAIRDRVASASALDDVGRGDDALARMRAAAAEAKRLGIPALEVEVGLALGQLELDDGLASKAEVTLREVVTLARRIGDRAGEAEASVSLAGALVLRGKLVEGERQLAAAEQLAGDRPRVRIMMLQLRTMIDATRGDQAKVRAGGEQHRALVEQLYGRDDKRMVHAMIAIAASSVAVDPATSRAVLGEARALATRVVGRSHPLLAEIDRAQCLAERANPAVARKHCESARAFFAAGGAAYRFPLAKTLLAMSVFDAEHMIELVRAAREGFEPGSVHRAMADGQLAAGYRRAMNHVAAVDAAREAVRAYEAAMDPEAPPLVQELRWLGRDLLLLGRGDEAVAVLARVAEVQAKTQAPIPMRVEVLLQLAGAQFYSTQHRTEVRATIDRVIELAAASQNPESSVAEALFSSAALFLEHEQLDDAARTLDRAIPLAAKHGNPSLRARLELVRHALESNRGNLAAARRAQRRAAAHAPASDPFVVFMVRVADCELLVRERAMPRAITTCTALVAIAEAGFGRDHPAVLAILVPLAEAQLARRDPAAAVTIDRAIAIAPDARRLAAARLVKAQILDAARDRLAARALAETALADLERAADAPTTAARIRTWLAAHPPP